ncbi:CCAAT/enhancer-binding protein gamma [Nymphon striatum]|nr:CCAAT/enhancer-binding protein gamma [Nymphon striatum]
MSPMNQMQCEVESIESSDNSVQNDFLESHEGKKFKSDKGGEDYKKKRERNNLAVKKSRSKSKLRTQQTLERVNQLKSENEMLEGKVKILSKELSFLKDLFLAHAGNAHGQNMSAVELNTLLSEENPPGTWAASKQLTNEENNESDNYSPIKCEV